LTKEQYIKQCWKSVDDYIESVYNRTIVTNENIRLAIQRYLDDKEREDLEWRPEAIERVFTFAYYCFVDKNKRFILQPFQAFIIAALFGSYYKDTNTRKYLYAFLFIGRKNGKTTFVCFLQLYFMIADGVSFPSSILIAGSQNQANDTSFRALKEMIMCSPSLRTRLVAMKSNKIVFKDPNRYGWCKTVPAIEDRLEGLNPTSALLDELHTYKDAQKFNVIKNALGTKENPMLFLISTAGYGKDSFCAQLVETGRNVLRGISNDDRFFYLLYELEEGDNIEDESNWIKANPGLGTILDYKLFKDQFNTNKTIPSLFNDFVTKRFNIFLEENSQWIEPDELEVAFKYFNEENFKEYPCYVGIDLSSTRDLTAIVCLWDVNGEFYAKAYFFFVETAENALRKGSINIKDWIAKGYVIPCSTPTIDFELLMTYIKDINSKNNVVGLFYDPWHFDLLKNSVSEEGIWAQGIPSTMRHLDPAVRFLETLFYEKKINILQNKCMIWNFRNVVIYKDLNGNMKPNKNKSADSIDGVVALINAISGYLKQNLNAASNFLKNI